MPVQILDLFPSFGQVAGASSGSVLVGTEMAALLRQEFSNNMGAPITAHAGGGQAGATPCYNAINWVSTVATLADSLKLPLALPGAQVIIINHGAASAQVFGQPLNPNTGVGDTIAAAAATTQSATATGVAQASAAAAFYVCFNAGQWKQIL